MTPLLSPRLVGAIAAHPLVEVELDSQGHPLAATAIARIERTPAHVWSVVSDLERHARFIPMIHRTRREGQRVHVDLRFKIALFTAKFSAEGLITSEEGRWIDVAYVAGEPRDLAIRFEVEGVDEGRATVLATRVGFDPFSLGWMVSFFLKHHPEIRFGVVSGSALTLLDAIRRAM
ncbi:MAG: hypothetical protein EXR72_10915 [Myxococcales bacterium]|nr:hypothetical protein [Myxococcales bacterium]